MRYFFPAILLVINIGSGIAQNTGGKPGLTGPGDYLVKQYNSESGLPQNSAKDLLLDQKKFLWIATEDGLVRFDGQRFRVYNTANTPILKSNRFSVISETPQHEVLLGSSYDRNEI
ncbi:MAG TPA: two-component regulator propeller domain-containing protein, partial [Chitinophagaceae bacterium]|nr:two-component regulator propeller domain-containing protein [Chitinophagaceae bacterium]